MRKLLMIILLLFIIIIFSVYLLLTNNNKQTNNLKIYNREYEEFLDKTILGTELATLINKVTNLNEKNNIEKDENKYYIDNGLNSIKIDIKILLTEKIYPMEEIYNKNTSEFVKYFNLEKFRCTKIEYHTKTGKINKMFFEQVIE